MFTSGQQPQAFQDIDDEAQFDSEGGSEYSYESDYVIDSEQIQEEVQVQSDVNFGQNRNLEDINQKIIENFDPLQNAIAKQDLRGLDELQFALQPRFFDKDYHHGNPPVFPYPNPQAHMFVQRWIANKDKLKTTAAMLVMCLNPGVDPPDVLRISPCARQICWTSLAPAKSKELDKVLESIGKTLAEQYLRWQPKLKCRPPHMDPNKDEIRKYCQMLRKSFQLKGSDRVLFHYNGYGTPMPTTNGEIWVFNKQMTQYLPLNIGEIQQWLQGPTMYVVDCSKAGLLLRALKRLVLGQEGSTQQQQYGSRVKGGQQQGGSMGAKVDTQGGTMGNNFDQQIQQELEGTKDFIFLGACQENEQIPCSPSDMPNDVFTSCLTTPIRVALWYHLNMKKRAGYNYNLASKDLIEKIPGSYSERLTLLGSLNWIFTAVTDTIAWDTFPTALFQKLFRQDLLTATLFRNFILAERVMVDYGCTPITFPALPSTKYHKMWEAWDMAVEQCLQKLPEYVNETSGPLTNQILERQFSQHQAQPPASHLLQQRSLERQYSKQSNTQVLPQRYDQNNFFNDQINSFERWLNSAEMNPNFKSQKSPEALPIVLQVLLSQAHRSKALNLLMRFMDLGPWAIEKAISVGIFPYVLKLLQTKGNDLLEVLIFIQAKIMSIDKFGCMELFSNNSHLYFLECILPNFGQTDGREKEQQGAELSNLAKAQATFILTIFWEVIPNQQSKGQILIRIYEDLISNIIDYVESMEMTQKQIYSFLQKHDYKPINLPKEYAHIYDPRRYQQLQNNPQQFKNPFQDYQQNEREGFQIGEQVTYQQLNKQLLDTQYLAQWSILLLARLLTNTNNYAGIYEAIQLFVSDHISTHDDPELRASGVYLITMALKQLAKEQNEELKLRYMAKYWSIFQKLSLDGSMLVRSEVIVGLGQYISMCESQFMEGIQYHNNQLKTEVFIHQSNLKQAQAIAQNISGAQKLSSEVLSISQLSAPEIKGANSIQDGTNSGSIYEESPEDIDIAQKADNSQGSSIKDNEQQIQSQGKQTNGQQQQQQQQGSVDQASAKQNSNSQLNLHDSNYTTHSEEVQASESEFQLSKEEYIRQIQQQCIQTIGMVIQLFLDPTQVVQKQSLQVLQALSLEAVQHYPSKFNSQDSNLGIPPNFIHRSGTLQTTQGNGSGSSTPRVANNLASQQISESNITDFVIPENEPQYQSNQESQYKLQNKSKTKKLIRQTLSFLIPKFRAVGLASYASNQLGNENGSLHNNSMEGLFMRRNVKQFMTLKKDPNLSNQQNRSSQQGFNTDTNITQQQQLQQAMKQSPDTLSPNPQQSGPSDILTTNRTYFYTLLIDRNAQPQTEPYYSLNLARTKKYAAPRQFRDLMATMRNMEQHVRSHVMKTQNLQWRSENLTLSTKSNYTTAMSFHPFLDQITAVDSFGQAYVMRTNQVQDTRQQLIKQFSMVTGKVGVYGNRGNTLQEDSLQITQLYHINDFDSSSIVACSTEGIVNVWRGHDSAYSEVQQATAWQAVPYQEDTPFRQGYPAAYSMKQTGGTLLFASGGAEPLSLRMWDLEYEKVRQINKVSSTLSEVNKGIEFIESCEFEKTAVVGCADGYCRLFDLRQKGLPITEFQAHTHSLVGLVYLNQPHRGIRSVVTASIHNDLNLWDLRQTTQPLTQDYYAQSTQNSMSTPPIFPNMRASPPPISQPIPPLGPEMKQETYTSYLDSGQFQIEKIPLQTPIRQQGISANNITIMVGHSLLPAVVLGTGKQELKLYNLDRKLQDNPINQIDNMQSMRMTQFDSLLNGNQKIGPVSCLAFHPFKHKLGIGTAGADPYCIIHDLESVQKMNNQSQTSVILPPDDTMLQK